ncbi:MAG: Stp1/IreP family PP2C-type Ser/Thr phosphatase [Anaeromyxobacter sp.]|nr:Stp1/IreP family PP2C-type Ser/Thr phosphatase [Anaeromyxobacter sp.]MBL0276443.1 Stp1/IreP family PP2C-type Ser/Thr phosphatase [Anaeromyxobacter sp.]
MPRVAAPPLRIAARGLTDVGQRRDHNEDALLVDVDLGLFVVADGMGGHAGGGTASRLAVETIRAELLAVRAEEPGLFGSGAEGEENPLPDLLREAVERACAVIFEAAQSDLELAGMGTTVTAALVDGRAAFVAHVGDSRAYLLRGGHIYQVTQDHSLVAEQLRLGAISAEEAKHSRFKNIITRSVGFERDVLVDLMGLELEGGDTLVVCCDGLSNLVEDQEIQQLVAEHGVDAVERLVDLANDRGGDDNITVAVVRLAEPEGAPAERDEQTGQGEPGEQTEAGEQTKDP